MLLKTKLKLKLILDLLKKIVMACKDKINYLGIVTFQ